jgi:diacylglycerol O-acyltransferase
MQQLSAHDASFLYMETPTAPMDGAGVTIYDQSTAPGGKVTYKGILKHIEDRLHLLRPFRQKLVRVPFNADHPWWIEDKDFDLEYHVRHIALPEPGDWRQLMIQVARLNSRALDETKPLWEIYVIEGLDRVEGFPPGCFALLQKMHHAAVDGVTGMEISQAIHTLEPDAPPPPPPAEPWRGEDEPNPADLLARAAWNNATQPFRAMEIMAASNAATERMAAYFQQRPNQRVQTQEPAPRTRFNDVVSAHRVCEARLFELDNIRKIRGLVPGCTVNDVILSIVGGAMREYLEDKGELPISSLTAMCPISLRGTTAQGGATNPDGSPVEAGNQVGAMVVALRTDIPDARSRLAAIYAGTKSAKELNNAVGARTLTDMGKVVPAAMAALAGRMAATQAIINEDQAPPYNTVVSNVPGPQQPLYFAGAKAVAMFGFGMIHNNMGLMQAVPSYCGRVAISISCDRAMMPDPAFYAQCLQNSYDDLFKAASG